MKKFYEAPEMSIEVVNCADVVTSSDVVVEPKHAADCEVANGVDVDNFVSYEQF